MTLWEYIKEKMLENPTQTISEKGVSMTYEDLCIFAESFAKKLTADYYGILGYFDDSERTRKTIKRGWLHTGDLGYVGKNGRLYIKGRTDDMIIRAGMNIYPAEIENILSTDGRVCEVQVYGYSKNGTQEIGMTVSGDFTSPDEILLLCKQYLPSYHIPSKIDLVDEIEKNLGGKRKRRITI